MRNPNGYGTVVRLSGNRRNPYAARITVGYRDNGQPIYSALGYFSRRDDALVCLAKFHDEQYSVDYRNITLAELFAKLQEIEFPQYSEALRSSLLAAYRHVARLESLKYRTIKKHQMQSCIDNCGKSYATQTHIRNLFWHLDRLAFDLDIISKRYSETLVVKTADPKKKTPFTDEEVRELWNHRPESDEALFMLYTGCRRSEMLLMRCCDIRPEFMTGGIKTEAGKNRVIPIHPDLKPILYDHLSEAEFLFDSPGSFQARTQDFTRRWNSIMSKLGMNHTSHDCRHTFRSKLDSAGANKVAIDLIMGHKTGDVGERVYTHKTLKELTEAMGKLSYSSPR